MFIDDRNLTNSTGFIQGGARKTGPPSRRSTWA